jgi:hypothetical protein
MVYGGISVEDVAETAIVNLGADHMSAGLGRTKREKAMSEIRDFLEKHLQGIFDYDVEHYKATTAEGLGGMHGNDRLPHC